GSNMMSWQLVKFLKERSVAAVPKSWIKKLKNSVVCYWPKRNVESLRKKIIQPPIKKGSTMYKCKILMNGETYTSFEAALEAEKSYAIRSSVKTEKKLNSTIQKENRPPKEPADSNSGNARSVRIFNTVKQENQNLIERNFQNENKKGTDEYKSSVEADVDTTEDNQSVRIIGKGDIQGPSTNLQTLPVTVQANQINNISNKQPETLEELQIPTTKYFHWKKKIVDTFSFNDLIVDKAKEAIGPPSHDHPMIKDILPVIAPVRINQQSDPDGIGTVRNFCNVTETNTNASKTNGPAIPDIVTLIAEPVTKESVALNALRMDVEPTIPDCMAITKQSMNMALQSAPDVYGTARGFCNVSQTDNNASTPNDSAIPDIVTLIAEPVTNESVALNALRMDVEPTIPDCMAITKQSMNMALQSATDVYGTARGFCNVSQTDNNASTPNGPAIPDIVTLIAEPVTKESVAKDALRMDVEPTIPDCMAITKQSLNMVEQLPPDVYGTARDFCNVSQTNNNASTPNGPAIPDIVTLIAEPVTKESVALDALRMDVEPTLPDYMTVTKQSVNMIEQSAPDVYGTARDFCNVSQTDNSASTPNGSAIPDTVTLIVEPVTKESVAVNALRMDVEPTIPDLMAITKQSVNIVEQSARDVYGTVRGFCNFSQTNASASKTTSPATPDIITVMVDPVSKQSMATKELQTSVTQTNSLLDTTSGILPPSGQPIFIDQSWDSNIDLMTTDLLTNETLTSDMFFRIGDYIPMIDLDLGFVDLGDVSGENEKQLEDCHLHSNVEQFGQKNVTIVDGMIEFLKNGECDNVTAEK
ncbi:hypothetical protein Bhyg_04005, partial [Pseudolycoriella hygida]